MLISMSLQAREGSRGDASRGLDWIIRATRGLSDHLMDGGNKLCCLADNRANYCI